ncbi:hypothetical protein Tco_1130721 [Tanacetum coccineum]
MPYPRFTTVIINHFISKDKTISMRNMINLHIVRDDFLLDIKASKAYKTYHEFATGKVSPKKARKFKKVTSPSKKLSPILEEEPVKKPKKAKKPSKKSTTVPIVGVVIRDTPGVYVSKKKATAKGDRGKGMELLSNAALLEVAQVLDESQDKTTGIDEGTGTKSGVPYVYKDHLESENESWGDSEEDDSNDDVSDDVSKGEDAENDGDGDNDASDNERTDSDEEENPNLTLKDNEEEETQDDEYIHTSNSYASTDEETNDDYREFDEEEYDKLYKDVNVTPNVTERVKERKGDAEMTNAAQENKTEGSMQSSFVLSDFASKFLNLDNVPLADNEVTSMMNVKVSHEESNTQAPSLLIVPVTAISVTSTVAATTIPLIITPITPIPQLVSALERELSQVKQVDHTTQILTQILAIVDEHLSTRIGFASQTALQSYTIEFEKKAQAKKEKYIDIIEKSVKEIIKDEVKSQLPQILPKEISDFATPVIQSTINESLENVVLAKSSSQPQSTYEAAASLTEFELKKILLDKLEKTYSLKRGREDKDKDEDPSVGSDQGLKKRKMSKDAKPLKGFKSKEYKSSSSKGSKSQSKSSCKPAQADEPGKPLPLIEDQGRQVVHANYFFNNDLKYLKGGSSSRKYTTSTTKIKAAKYDNIEGIKDMVQTLWSPVKVTYDKHAVWGTSYWGLKRKRFYAYACHWKSLHDVFFNKRIIVVTQVKVVKKYDYGYLDEIIVRREVHKLYKFKEGDFPRLNMRDIEDTLLLLV